MAQVLKQAPMPCRLQTVRCLNSGHNLTRKRAERIAQAVEQALDSEPRHWRRRHNTFCK